MKPKSQNKWAFATMLVGIAIVLDLIGQAMSHKGFHFKSIYAGAIILIAAYLVALRQKPK